jgi:hypothetical protein
MPRHCAAIVSLPFCGIVRDCDDARATKHLYRPLSTIVKKEKLEMRAAYRFRCYLEERLQMGSGSGGGRTVLCAVGDAAVYESDQRSGLRCH